MRTWLLGLLIAFPAWAQEPYPARNDCDKITRELAMRPPANGDKGRANYDYQSYIGFCQTRPWSEMIGANDLEALKPLLCAHGGFVDHVHNQLSCF